MNSLYTRRDVLRTSLLGSSGLASFLTGLGGLGGDAMAHTFVPNTLGDHKTLICLYFNGGNDSMNMIMPLSGSSGTTLAPAFQSIRPNLVSGLAPVRLGGTFWGLHPGLAQLAPLFATTNGPLSVAGNVGPLAQAIANRAQFDATLNTTLKLPESLGSHLDQTIEWQSGYPATSGRYGLPVWAGRMSEIASGKTRGTSTPNDLLRLITLSGENHLLRGEFSSGYGLSASGVKDLYVKTRRVEGGTNGSLGAGLHAGCQELLKAEANRLNGNRLKAEYARRAYDGFKAASDFEAEYTHADGHIETIINHADRLASTLTLAGLRQQLATALKLIQLGHMKGVDRQVIFIGFGAFDSHVNQAAGHTVQMQAIGEALSRFWQSLLALGWQDKVTLFTASEFGRSLHENSAAGTDHAWGGHQLVLGGAVKGGQLTGKMPNFNDPTSDDFWTKPTSMVQGSNLIPGDSVEAFYMPMARWFSKRADGTGILTDAQLSQMLPNAVNLVSGSQPVSSIALDLMKV
jgi:uncharacterized protein (DUF1501 family)